MPPRLSCRHRRTLEAVFAEPVPANLDWDALAALIVALGAVRSERAGSRVAFLLRGRVAVFHRPHPRKEAPRPLVRDVRDFLTSAGIRP